MKDSIVENKVVVVTGASSGLGASIARLLAQHGASVVLGARRRDRIDQVAEEITSAGGNASGYSVDVTKRVDVEALIQGAIADFGRVDVMVNNAGVSFIAPIERLNVDDWDRMIDANVKGVLYGVAAALPHMQKQKSGHIINIASVAGLKVFAPGGTVYSATKFAVRALTEGLRIELHAQNIRCTMITPGGMATELGAGSSDAASAELIKEQFAENLISPDSVARAVLYAIGQPPEVEIDEIVIRPTAQEF